MEKAAKRKYSQCSKEEIIQAITANPHLYGSDIARMLGTTSMDRINRLRKASGLGPVRKVSDEQIIQAIAANPDLSGRKLAELLGIAATNRITKLKESYIPPAPPPPPVPRLNWKAYRVDPYSTLTRRLIRSIAVKSLARVMA